MNAPKNSAESIFRGMEVAPDYFSARLRARRVDAIKRVGVPFMIVGIINAWVLVLVIEMDGRGSRIALVWAAAVTALALRSLFMSWVNRDRPPPETTSPGTIGKVIRSAALFGLIWAVPGVTFFPDLSGFSLAFGAAVITGMIAGGAFGLYPIPAAAMAFILPIILGGILGVAMHFGLMAVGPAIIAATFVFFFRRVIRRNADLFDSEFRGRLELERRNRLIEDLLEDARLEVLGSRRLSEARLTQAKKMEAIGQLTSGIAHDFNNLLTAIQGNAELLSLDGKSEPGLVDAIIQVSKRGARQVQRLLSIAQKQTLHPEPLNLRALLSDLQRMLQPTLGMSHPIEVQIAPETRLAFVDPAQLENALINLVFNARDALPDGGKIQIACRNAPDIALRGNQAPQIDITVTDHGIGMESETRERALDPFFTTKKFGQGNGLGLSTVAGFTRQSGGEVLIDSVPTEGTSITLRLPAAGGVKQRLPGGNAQASAAPASATILLVEDMQEVLAVARQFLEGLGYSVVSASDAEQALALLEAGEQVDLVLTDILLSGSMTGLYLTKEIRRKTPTLPIAFMSAWSLRTVSEDEGFTEALLQKPFSREQLAAHVHRALLQGGAHPVLKLAGGTSTKTH